MTRSYSAKHWIPSSRNRQKRNYHVHYAVKANANRKLLRIICAAGFGADCVSGGEIKACLDAGFPADKIVFAGVGKSDWEINVGLDAGIAYFNVESIPELEVINQLAGEKDKIARVSFRINPDVRGAYPCQYHDRTGRKQIRHSHGRHGKGHRNRCIVKTCGVRRAAFPYRFTDT